MNSLIDWLLLKNRLFYWPLLAFTMNCKPNDVPNIPSCLHRSGCKNPVVTQKEKKLSTCNYTDFFILKQFYVWLHTYDCLRVCKQLTLTPKGKHHKKGCFCGVRRMFVFLYTYVCVGMSFYFFVILNRLATMLLN